MIKISPLFRRYKELQKKYPDALILLRINNYYKVLGDNAKSASEVCKTTCTRRAPRAYLFTGFPKRDLEKYLKDLVNKFGKVAIVDNY